MLLLLRLIYLSQIVQIVHFCLNFSRFSFSTHISVNIVIHYIYNCYKAVNFDYRSFRRNTVLSVRFHGFTWAVASLGGGRKRADAPGDTLQGVTPEETIFLWANLQRIVEKRGRTGKKSVGWHPGGGDTRVKAIKSDSDSDSDEQKSRQIFQKKIKGWHPQLPPRVSPTLVTPLYVRRILVFYVLYVS